MKIEARKPVSEALLLHTAVNIRDRRQRSRSLDYLALAVLYISAIALGLGILALGFGVPIFIGAGFAKSIAGLTLSNWLMKWGLIGTIFGLIGVDAAQGAL